MAFAVAYGFLNSKASVRCLPLLGLAVGPAQQSRFAPAGCLRAQLGQGARACGVPRAQCSSLQSSVLQA